MLIKNFTYFIVIKKYVSDLKEIILLSSNYVKYKQKESEYENREKELYIEIKKLTDDITVKNKKIYDLQYIYI